MKILSWALCAFFGFSAVAAAQDWVTAEACSIPKGDTLSVSEDWLAAEAAQYPDGIGRLWRIITDQGAVSHLWGTMHDASPEVTQLPAPFIEIIQNATVVATEMDPLFRTRGEIDAWFQRVGEFQTAEIPREVDFLSDEVHSWVVARLQAVGYEDETWLNYFTLGGLGQLLLSHPCNDFSSNILPIQDNKIVQLAIEAGVPTMGLEPRDAFLTEMNKGQRRATAIAIVKAYAAYLDPAFYVSPDPTFIRLYQRGHVAGMMALDRNVLRDAYGLMVGDDVLRLTDDYLVRERNVNFAKKAQPLLAKGGAVLAVGSFHLPAKGGLIDLFRQAGYAVERVPLDGEDASQ